MDHANDTTRSLDTPHPERRPDRRHADRGGAIDWTDPRDRVGVARPRPAAISHGHRTANAHVHRADTLTVAGGPRGDGDDRSHDGATPHEHPQSGLRGSVKRTVPVGHADPDTSSTGADQYEHPDVPDAGGGRALSAGPADGADDAGPAGGMTGEELRTFLQRHGWSQVDLAVALGISAKSTVNKWCGGTRRIPLARQADIRRVLAHPPPGVDPARRRDVTMTSGELVLRCPFCRRRTPNGPDDNYTCIHCGAFSRRAYCRDHVEPVRCSHQDEAGIAAEYVAAGMDVPPDLARRVAD